MKRTTTRAWGAVDKDGWCFACYPYGKYGNTSRMAKIYANDARSDAGDKVVRVKIGHAPRRLPAKGE